jgi:hypothetical protein
MKIDWLKVKWMLLTIWHVTTHPFESEADNAEWCFWAAIKWCNEEHKRKAVRNG